MSIRAIVRLTTAALALAMLPAQASAWYCEAESTQKNGFARGWGRHDDLAQARRWAMSQCMMRANGSDARCRIVRCVP